MLELETLTEHCWSSLSVLTG